MHETQGTQVGASQLSIPAPETIMVADTYIYCDGAGEVSPALGHPRVYLTMPAGQDFVDCTYCDRRFALAH